MLSDVCRYAGIIFASFWLSTSALAAPIVDSDDNTITTSSPASVSEINVDISPPVGEESPLSIPQAPKSSTVNDVLNVWGAKPEAELLPPTQQTAFTAPIVDYSASTTATTGVQNLSVHAKLPEAPAAAPSPLQPTSDLIVQQNSSPLIIATPEPSSIGLLLIASTTLLARRRVSRRA